MTFKQRTTMLLFTVFALVLAGCSSAFTMETTPVDSVLVTQSLRYFHNGGSDIGPAYNFVVEVPEDWVGEFVTKTVNNRTTFEYRVSDSQSVPIFFVEALSDVQYWEQIGSYPGDYINIANEIDTYFVYSFPMNAGNSPITDEVFDGYAAQVPDVMATFTAELAED